MHMYIYIYIYYSPTFILYCECNIGDIMNGDCGTESHFHLIGLQLVWLEKNSMTTETNQYILLILMRTKILIWRIIQPRIFNLSYLVLVFCCDSNFIPRLSLQFRWFDYIQ